MVCLIYISMLSVMCWRRYCLRIKKAHPPSGWALSVSHWNFHFFVLHIKIRLKIHQGVVLYITNKKKSSRTPLAWAFIFLILNFEWSRNKVRRNWDHCKSSDFIIHPSSTIILYAFIPYIGDFDHRIKKAPQLSKAFVFISSI